MSRLRDTLFTVAIFGATILVLGFLVLPIVAIFARVPLHLLIDQLRRPDRARRARAHGRHECDRTRRDHPASARPRRTCSAGGASAAACS